MGSRDHSYRCPICCEYRGGMNDEECMCDRQGPAHLDRVAADVIARHAPTLERLALVDRMRTLAACIHAAAVEEMRVRLAINRMAERHKHEFGAARRLMPTGGRRG